MRGERPGTPELLKTSLTEDGAHLRREKGVIAPVPGQQVVQHGISHARGTGGFLFALQHLLDRGKPRLHVLLTAADAAQRDERPHPRDERNEPDAEHDSHHDEFRYADGTKPHGATPNCCSIPGESICSHSAATLRVGHLVGVDPGDTDCTSGRRDAAKWSRVGGLSRPSNGRAIASLKFRALLVGRPAPASLRGSAWG